MLRAILLLPVNAAIVIPAAILWATGEGGSARYLAVPADLRFWPAALLVAAGLVLAVWAVRLFATKGEGTPAPWEPPRRLVMVGPYRHVRNPMIASMIAILLGEALFLASLPLLAWAGVFILANLLYIPLFEEPRLEHRFGEDYRRYRRHVPRWVPRLSAWRDAIER